METERLTCAQSRGSQCCKQHAPLAFRGCDDSPHFILGEISLFASRNFGQHERPVPRPFADDLRRAANSLAVVGLVTRLHHWVSIFVEEITSKSAKHRGLVNNLKLLNERTGFGPVSIEFFEDLVTVRDAIVHADYRIEWSYQDKKRQVSGRYANATSGEVEFTETHLDEAIENSVTQVK